MAVTANSPNRESRFILLTGFAELYRYNCSQSSKEALVFFLGGFLTSRFGAFLFAILKVYAIGQAVQGRWIKLTNTLNTDAARFRFVRNPTRIWSELARWNEQCLRNKARLLFIRIAA
jgi:hypothetical protein